MRTYQKHAALSMMSSLPRISLPIPCQALSRETTFPAVVQESALKVLIFQGSAPDVEKISLLFPRRQGPKRDLLYADPRQRAADRLPGKHRQGYGKRTAHRSTSGR